jgi:hypothetical protein
MKKLIVLMAMMIAITGCANETLTPTPIPPNPAEVGMTMFANRVNAEATQAAVNQVFTATAQVAALTQTQQAGGTQAAVTQQARIDAQATANQERADAQATSARERSDARATQQRLDAEATQQQAKRDQESTATHEAFMAHQTMTQQAFQVTSTAQVIGSMTAYPQTQQSIYATQTMDAAYGVAQATAAYAGAQSVELAVRREQVTNMTRAWVPWMGFVILLAVLSVVALRISRMRVVQKDAFGSLPGMVLDGAAVDLDTGMSARILKDGSVDFKQHDDRLTEREQKVKLVRALPAGRQDLPPLLIEGPRKEPVIEVIEPGTINRQILDEIQDQVVEEE